MSNKVQEDCTHLILEDGEDGMDCSEILQRLKAAGGIESLENFRNRLKSKLQVVHSRSCIPFCSGQSPYLASHKGTFWRGKELRRKGISSDLEHAWK